MAASAEDRLRAQAHTVGLLNEVEAVLTRALGYPREQVEKLTRPLYELCDRDEETPAAVCAKCGKPWPCPMAGLYPHAKKHGRS